mmetsp:Transcript_67619/g.209204  ORF Transcript_67619/g.209204 Transcript_67619/m.209204 type:complete len:165 (-) Transcript_67619:104-598(-)
MGKWIQGERYAYDIIHDLNKWTEAWLDWNLVLDETGGPNHKKNFCMAPILADTTSDTLMFQPSYYYIGHFSRYIRPGAVGVGCCVQGGSAEQRLALEVTAFENLDGTIAAVVLNTTEQPVSFQLAVADSGHHIKALAWAPERSITTFIVPRGDTVPYAHCPSGG